MAGQNLFTRSHGASRPASTRLAAGVALGSLVLAGLVGATRAGPLHGSGVYNHDLNHDQNNDLQPSSERAHAPELVLKLGQLGSERVVPHDLIGHEGGAIQVMRARGDGLIMGHGPRLVSLDVSAPAQPRVIARTSPLGGAVRDIAAESTSPNAVDGRAGIGWTLIEGDSLVGVELASLATVGSVAVATDTVGIALVGDHLWVATKQGGLIGYDVSDAGSPIPVGRVDGIASPYAVAGLAAVRNHVLVALGSEEDGSVLLVIDVSTPSAPAIVGRVASRPSDSWRARAVYPAGDSLVWLMGSYPDTLLGVDLSDPGAPVIVSSTEAEGAFGSTLFTVGGSSAFAIGGDGGHNSFTVTAFNLNDPAQVSTAGPHALPWNSDPSGGIVVAGDTLWYATSNGKLLGLDALSTETGMTVSHSSLTVGPSRLLSLSGALGLSSTGESLEVLDFSSRTAPTPLGETLLHWYPEDIAFATDSTTVPESRALVSTDGEMDVLGGELHVVDLSQPTEPNASRFGLRGRSPSRIAIDGERAATILHTSSMFGESKATLLSLSPALTATIRGELPDPNGFGDLLIEGATLFAATPGAYTGDTISLVVADIGDLDGPVRRGSVELAEAGRHTEVRLARRDPYVFVIAVSRAGSSYDVVHSALHIIDASDLENPIEVAEVSLAARPTALSYADDYLFVATASGTQVFGVHDPAAPQLMGKLPTGADAPLDVHVDRGLVFVSAGAGGLYILAPHFDDWPVVPTPTPTATATQTSTVPGPSSTPSATPPTPTVTPGGPTVVPMKLYLPRLENN